ncbi:MAG TPA: LuxR C-terminal-related transcriptional regulator [Rhizomicrobium sp.]|nr:LuxR C-terminal-related transcriptional regulator [Rhizomicrobium sp.]
MRDTSPVCIVGDDDDFRLSVRALLESASFSVKEYISATDFFSDGIFGAACLVADIQMPQTDGLALQYEVAKRRCDLPVVLMSGRAQVQTAVSAMKAGAVDFIERPFEDEVFLSSVRRAIEIGERSRSQAAETRGARKLVASLTPREHAVLEELVAGSSNKVTAQKLGISPRTIEVYRAQIMTKLRSHSLSELVRIAMAAARPLPPN